MHRATRHLTPRITTLIRTDHTHVLSTFHKYRLDLAPERKKALFDMICTSLEIHAKLEEEIFYPAMRQAMPELVDKSVPEHNEMRRLIATLKTMDAGNPDYDVTFMSLMRTIIHHVADEETMLLPEAERVLGERLEELGWAMTQRRMELAGPRAGEIAMNTARAHPMLVATVAAAVAVGGYLAWRGFSRSSTDVAASRWRRDVAAPARKLFDRSMHRSSRLLDRPAKFLERSARAAKRPAKRLLSYVH